MKAGGAGDGTSAAPLALLAIAAVASALFVFYCRCCCERRRQVDMRGDYEPIAECARQKRLAKVACMMLNLSKAQPPR